MVLHIRQVAGTDGPGSEQRVELARDILAGGVGPGVNLAGGFPLGIQLVQGHQLQVAPVHGGLACGADTIGIGEQWVNRIENPVGLHQLGGHPAHGQVAAQRRGFRGDLRVERVLIQSVVVEQQLGVGVGVVLLAGAQVAHNAIELLLRHVSGGDALLQRKLRHPIGDALLDFRVESSGLEVGGSNVVRVVADSFSGISLVVFETPVGVGLEFHQQREVRVC